jgi:hypothetical protein
MSVTFPKQFRLEAAWRVCEYETGDTCACHRVGKYYCDRYSDLANEIEAIAERFAEIPRSVARADCE